MANITVWALYAKFFTVGLRKRGRGDEKDGGRGEEREGEGNGRRNTWRVDDEQRDRGTRMKSRQRWHDSLNILETRVEILTFGFPE